MRTGTRQTRTARHTMLKGAVVLLCSMMWMGSAFASANEDQLRRDEASLKKLQSFVTLFAQIAAVKSTPQRAAQLRTADDQLGRFFKKEKRSQKRDVRIAKEEVKRSDTADDRKDLMAAEAESSRVSELSRRFQKVRGKAGAPDVQERRLVLKAMVKLKKTEIRRDRAEIKEDRKMKRRAKEENAQNDRREQRNKRHMGVIKALGKQLGRIAAMPEDAKRKEEVDRAHRSLRSQLKRSKRSQGLDVKRAREEYRFSKSDDDKRDLAREVDDVEKISALQRRLRSIHPNLSYKAPGIQERRLVLKALSDLYRRDAQKLRKERREDRRRNR